MNIEESLGYLNFDSMPTKTELKSRYRELCKTCHPDIFNGPTWVFLKIQESYTYLLEEIDNGVENESSRSYNGKSKPKQSENIDFSDVENCKKYLNIDLESYLDREDTVILRNKGKSVTISKKQIFDMNLPLRMELFYEFTSITDRTASESGSVIVEIPAKHLSATQTVLVDRLALAECSCRYKLMCLGNSKNGLLLGTHNKEVKLNVRVGDITINLEVIVLTEYI